MTGRPVREFLLWSRDALRLIDRQVMVVLISAILIQIISRYYAGRRFFHAQFAAQLSGHPLFNLYEYLYWFCADFVVQFGLPLLCIVLVLKKPLRQFGLGLGNASLGIRLALTFWVAMLPILWVVSTFDGFQATYPHSRVVRTDWGLFVLYELSFILYMIGWEFVWRGYMLFGLREKFGDAAVLVQMIPFVLLHVGKPVEETLGAVVGAILLGFLALRTGSFWYGVMVHVLVMASMDLLATLRFRAQVFTLNPPGVWEMILKGF